MALYSWQKTKYNRTWKIEVLGSGSADDLLVDKSPEYRFVSPPTDKSPGVYPRELVVPIVDRDGDRGYLTNRLFDEVLDVELSLDGSLYFKGKSWAEDRRRPLLQDEYETKFVVTDRLSELDDHTYDGNARTFNGFLREVLYKTGIELPIHLYTDWEEDNATGDLPDNHRVSFDEVDLTYLEALERFCHDFGFQVFQDDGVWVCRQVSYYTGNGITRWEVATDGSVSSSSVSGQEKSLSAPYKEESYDDGLKGVGEARATFNIPVLEGVIENDAFESFDGSDFNHWEMEGTVTQVEDDDKMWARIEDESASLSQQVERIVRYGDRLHITAEIRTNVSVPENHIDFLRVWFIDSRDGSEYVVTTQQDSISRVGSSNTFLYEHLIRVSSLNGLPTGFTGKVRFEYQFQDQGDYFTFYELDYLRSEFRINSDVNNRHVGTASGGSLTNRETIELQIGENSDQYAEYEIEFNDGSWKPTQQWDGDSQYVKRASDYLKVRNQNMNIVDYAFDLDEVDDLMAIYSFDGRTYLPVYMDITIGDNDVQALLIEHEETSNSISTDEYFDNGATDQVVGVPSSGGGGGAGGGGGTSDLYFEISEQLSEGDPEEIRGNIEAQQQDDDLDQIAALDPTSSDEGKAITIDSNGDYELDAIDPTTFLNTAIDQGVVFYDADLNSFDTVSGFEFENGLLRANEIRPNTGKFRSPTSYAFRNAGDTGYRDVQLAGLTATTGLFSDVLSVEDDIKLDDANTNVSTDTFGSGFAGSGMAFLQDGTWDGTLDNLTVRQRLRVYELLINQIRATNGSLVVTSATKTGREDDLGFAPVEQLGGTLDWTSSDPFWTESDQYWYRTYRVYIEENQRVPFVEDDLVIAQRFTGDGTYLVEGTVINVESGAQDPSDNSTRRYFDINITADSDVPTSGMDFVRWGNLSDPDRQGVLYLTADDDDAPYMDIVYGMDSHDKRNASGTVKGRIGRLDGIVDDDFPTLDGNQTNEFGVYIDGGYFNNVEVRGKITVLGGNAATEDYSDNNLELAKSYTDQEVTNANGSVTIRSSSAPSSRPNGSDLQVGDQWIDTDSNNEPYTYDGTDPYDPSGWIRDYTIIDGGYIETGTIALNRLNFTALTSEGDSDEIIATINASSEGVSISGDKITLDGDTTVTSDFEVQGKVNGTLEMAANGEITNANGDFTIDANGLSLTPSSSWNADASITWGTDFGIGAFGGAPNTIIHKASMHRFANDAGVNAMTVQADDFGGRVDFASAVYMNGLPTSEPASSGRVWNDGGTLKIAS